MTETRRACWVLTADEGMARLLRIHWAGSGRVRVTVEDDICDASSRHQRGRPSPLKGKGGHTYASEGYENETHRARFAKEVAVWLEQQAERHGIEYVAVFAPPRFLGTLQDSWSPRFAIHVDEYQGDLMHMSPADLARHPAMIGLMHGHEHGA